MSTIRKVTYEQLEKMWELIHRHRDVIMGKNKSASARENSRRLWIKVAIHLNSMSGVKKGYQGWSAYWNDYKGKLKRKCSALRAAQMRAGESTGAGHNGSVKTITLSDLEKKFLPILGTEFQSRIAVKEDPFPTTAEVTMESNKAQVLQTSQPILEVPGTSTQPLCSETETYKPSTSPQPVSPNECEQQLHRRRRLIMKNRAARRSLMESARMRAEASIESCNTLKGMLKVLTNIATTLNSINNKLPDLPTNG